MSENDLKKSLPVIDLEAKAEKNSVSSLDSEESSKSVNLIDSNNKNLFLTKIGITFMLYSLACFCTAIFILIDIKRTTIAYRAWSLQTMLWVFFTISIFIKIVFGFFGNYIRKLAKLVFPVDTFATVIFVLGLYYYLESYKTTSNYSYAPFVVIVCVNFFVSSFFFTLTTLYHSRSKEYNYILGTCMMTFFNVVTIIGLAFGWKQVVTITPWQYTAVGICFLFLNLYITVNSYYIINVRLDKYSESDAVWAFYSYWVDWVFAFWRNLFQNTAKIIRQKRRQAKKNKQAKSSEKKNKSGKKEKAPKERVSVQVTPEQPVASASQQPRVSVVDKKPVKTKAADKVEVKIA